MRRPFSSRRGRILGAAAALTLAVTAATALAITSPPAIYLSAMGTVLAIEAAAIAILLSRRLAPRPGAVEQRRVPQSDTAFAKLQVAVDQLDHGFIDEATSTLRAAVDDPECPRQERRFADQALRRAERSNPAPVTEHFDVVIVSNLNLPGGTTASNANEISLLTASGKTVGLFHHPLYAANTGRPINSKIADLVDGTSVRLVQPHAKVTCDLLIMRFPPFAKRMREDLPSIDAREKLLVVNQAPMIYYDARGGRKQVWDPTTVHSHLSEWIGGHRWTAAGPAVRQALVEHHAEELDGVDLAEDYWYPTLDLERLKQRPDEAPAAPFRIGRHSRDHVSKWPELASDLRACYPEEPDFQVRVLGGAMAAERILGRLPSNWQAYAFDSMPGGEFLAELDFYVYFPNSALLEAFGRAPVEAMASGVPTILPPSFEQVFGNGAMYAEPGEVRDLIRELAGDEAAYLVQQKRGIEAVERRFSFEAHRARFRALGIDL